MSNLLFYLLLLLSRYLKDPFKEKSFDFLLSPLFNYLIV